MSVAGNCGVQSSCSKSFLCIDPKSSDDFSLMDTSSPLWNLLWGISEILALGRAAFYGDSPGEPLGVLRDGTLLPVP